VTAPAREASSRTDFVHVLEEEYVRLNGKPCDPVRPAPSNGDLKMLYAAIHKDAKDGKRRSALCISGGGIRSATFSLGVLQELARRCILEKFDYLSTVSGGGYIGSWLSSYIRRRPDGIEQVALELGRPAAGKTSGSPNDATPPNGGTAAEKEATQNGGTPTEKETPPNGGTATEKGPTQNGGTAEKEATQNGGTPNKKEATQNGGAPTEKEATSDGGTATNKEATPNAAPASPKCKGGRKRELDDPLKPEADPIVNLRRYSNYLTPKLGLFSGDTWALTATYVRNLLLNWLMLLPVIVTALAVPRLMVALLYEPRHEEPYVAAFAFPLLAMATYYLARTRPAHNKASRQFIYTNKGFLTLAVAPFVLAAIFLVFMWARISYDFTQWSFTNIGLRDLVSSDGWARIAQASGGWMKVAIAFAVTNALASIVYMVRYAWATRKERRPGIRQDSTTNRFVAKKAALEIGAALVSGTVAAGVLYFFAQILFPAPIDNRVPLPSTAIWESYPPALPELTTALYACFGVPLVLCALFIQSALFVGLISWYNEEYDREWWARAAGWVLLAGVVWMAFAVLTIYGPVMIYQFPTIAATLGTGSGLVAIIGGKSAKTEGRKRAAGEKLDAKAALNLSVGVIASLFAVFLLALLSLVTSEILIEVNDLDDVLRTRNFELLKGSTYQLREVNGTPVTLEKRQWRRTLEPPSYPAVDVERFRALRHLYIVDRTTIGQGVFLVFILPWFGVVASMFIGVNQFSMHAMYRNRLVRAYLGASRDRERRKANPFTGFDPNDDFPVHRLRPEAFWTHSFSELEPFVRSLRPADPGRRLSIRSMLGREDKADNADAQTTEQERKAVLAGYIVGLLSTRTRRLMDEFLQVAPEPEVHSSLVESLSEDLNRIIEEHDLTRTKGNGTPAPQRATGDSLQPWRNRRLMNATFPGLRPCTSAKPYHVINATLNLVAGKELAWQERRAEPFAITPLYCGNRQLGYRSSRVYGGPGGISLGTAVAISGAAASPNMGYNSSPALSFLLTLFNVRLGWWLGNPGERGHNTYWRSNPKFSLGPLFDELSGNTDQQHPYVYLSDGGHFENLALYEMVQRRCHDIVLIDAAADPGFGFDDLGNAVRKIRIDLGISITFQAFDIFPRSEEKPANAKYCAIGTIAYSDVDGEHAQAGRLLYIKPAIYFNKESRDVYNYARQNPQFPHESTADQFFSESQFESYRALGEMTIEQIANEGGLDGEGVHNLIEAAWRYAESK
jgi:hypothetical protein